MKDNRHLYNYNYYHQSKNFQINPDRTHKLVAVILQYFPLSVLDVGCGLGSVVNELRTMKVDAVGVDFAPILKEIWGNKDYLKIADARELPFKDKEFKLIFSSDFFEHIDEEDIDKVASEMKRVGDRVITFVADDAGGALNKRQRQLHVTHKPLDWWKKKLKGIEVFSSHLYED